MAKQLSSLDMHFLLKELKALEGSRVDKIYNNGREEVFIQFYKTGAGKKILRIIVGKALFLTESKFNYEEPSHFCMMLRKHLDGKTLDSITQLEPERIIELIFKSKEETRKLYIELFAKGNIVLCSDDDIIIDSLTKHRFRERSIVPKEKYKHPKMNFNVFDIKKEDIINFIKNSKKDKIVTALAIELGLGGVYSEEVCLLSSIEKNINPKTLNNEKISTILKSIKIIINKKISPKIIYQNNEAIDVVPIDLEFYKNHNKKEFSSFNSALDYYFTNESKLIKKKSPYEKQINEIKRIIEEQKSTIKSLEKKEKENREKAELIYNNYQLLNEILKEINNASKKYSWDEIKRKLKGHKIVKDIDIKEKKIVVEI